MPIETLIDGGLTYYLISYDAAGVERTDDPDGMMSRRTLDALTGGPVTDVFLFSHGWQGDVPAARRQYGAWTTAMVQSTGRERLRQSRPGFHPLLVGLHWPSLPWGDENLESPASFAVGDTDRLVDHYAGTIADTPAARDALRVIFTAAAANPTPERLPEDVHDAYMTLDRESGLPPDGLGGAPGSDRDPFDPEEQYQAVRDPSETPSFGIGRRIWDGIVTPLRTLSFWKMKDRARIIGESGGHLLLRQLQLARPEARFHLMGHSFGCIVVSATLSGPSTGSPVAQPVDSLVLVQGAMSLWSCCSEIPHGWGGRRPGYFHRLAEGVVNGPIVTTQSRFDTAVGRWYPLAATAARQMDFAPALPRYGAVGAYGLQGEGLQIEDMDMLAADNSYGFQPGKVYNLNADAFIRNGEGFSGAHSDIAGAEVANAVWEAARR